MESIGIDNATRDLNPPKNWDRDTQGPCGNLLIKDVPMYGTNVMMSAWIPSKEELEWLNAGHPVILGIVGHTHPPLFIKVLDAKMESQKL